MASYPLCTRVNDLFYIGGDDGSGYMTYDSLDLFTFDSIFFPPFSPNMSLGPGFLFHGRPKAYLCPPGFSLPINGQIIELTGRYRCLPLQNKLGYSCFGFSRSSGSLSHSLTSRSYINRLFSFLVVGSGRELIHFFFIPHHLSFL